MNISIISFSLFLSFLVQGAFANLPDEINFLPYEQIYLELKNQVEETSQTLQKVEDEIAQKENERNIILNSISAIENDNANMQGQISESERSLDNLIARNYELSAQINRLSNRQRNLKRQIQDLNQNILNERQRLRPFRERLSRMNSNYNSKVDELKRTERRLDNTTVISQRINNQLNKLSREKDSLVSKLNSLKERFRSIEARISQSKSELIKLQRQLKNSQEKFKKQNAQKDRLSQRKNKILEKIKQERANDPASEEVKELRKQLKEVSQKIRQVDQEIAKTKQENTRLSNAVLKTQKLITNLTRDKQTLPREIKSYTSKVQTQEALVKTKREELRNANLKKRELIVLVDSQRQDVAALRQRINQVSRRLEEESRTLNSLTQRLSSTQVAARRVEQNLNLAYDESARNSEEVSRLEAEIPYLRSQIRTNEVQIASEKRALQRVESELDASFLRASKIRNELASLKEKESESFEQYISRDTLYRVQLAEAKELGKSQSSPAYSIGKNDGEFDGKNQSEAISKEMGKNLAHEQGYYWGITRSEIDGYNEGYEEGLKSDEDINRGRELGRASGIEGARSYANQVLKPKFFKEILKQSVSAESKVNLKLVESVQKIKIPSSYELVTKSLESLSGIYPLTDEEVELSLSIKTALDAKINAYKVSLQQTLKDIDEISRASNVFTIPQIPYGSPDCEGVYKGVEVFKSACQSSYRKEYEVLYLESYEEEFTRAYEEDILTKVIAKKDAAIEKEYQMAYQSSFDTAKNAGLADGKKDIFDKSFNEARAIAYDEELPRATEDVKKKAKYEVKDWISENATLTIVDAKFVQKNIQASDNSRAQLTFSNLSNRALKAPLKIEIKETKNLTTSSKVYFLKKADGNVKTIFDEIKFKALDNVTSKDTLKLSGRAYFSGGPYGGYRVEDFIIEQKAAINPKASLELDFLKNPRIVTRWRRRTLIHSLDVTIAPKFEDLPGNYELTLEVDPESKEYIDLKNTKVVTSSARLGRSQEVSFKYTFYTRGSGKEVNLKLNISYQGKRVQSKTIQIKPY